MDKKSNRGVMFVISVLLHSLLVLLPWQEKSRPLPVSSTTTIPIPIIDASQLPTLPALEPQPLPADPPSLSTPPVSLSPPVAVDPPAALTPDAPIPETSDGPESAIDEPVPEADWTADDPVPETNDSPIGEAAPEAAPGSNAVPASTPADGAKIAADWDRLVGHFQGQNEGLDDLFDIFDLFGKPGQVNQFFDENNQPRLDVSSFSHYLTKTPEEVFETVVRPELTSKKGFDLQPQENFPVELAYQFLQGEILRYLIIVRLSEGNGSVLIFSESLLGLEPQNP